MGRGDPAQEDQDGIGDTHIQERPAKAAGRMEPVGSEQERARSPHQSDTEQTGPQEGRS